MLDTKDIRRILESDKRTKIAFRGVYAWDDLPIHAPTSSLYVCNTDPSTRPGEHWVAIYIDGLRHAEYFDSFGLHPTVLRLETFLTMNSKCWFHNTKTIQDIFSDACGYHCIFYAVHRCIGFDMNSIVNMYTNDTVFNDAIAKKFLYKHVIA